MPLAAGLDFGNSVQQGFNTFFSYIPNIIGFLVILIIGYLIAKLIKAAVNKLAEKVGVDRAIDDTPAGSFVEKVSPGGRPSHLIGLVVFWIIFVFVLTAAIGALKIPAVTTFMNQVLAYLPNIIAAVLIFVVAAAVAGAVVAAVQRTMGDTPTGKLVETIVPGLIMAIAVFMILTQLQIAPSIVLITYGALLAMLALAGGLAFGLGGREVAAQMWTSAYSKTTQAQQDLQTGRGRAQEQVGQARQQVSGGQSSAQRGDQGGSTAAYGSGSRG